jgi:uncharacterized protein (DUF2384 family)
MRNLKQHGSPLPEACEAIWRRLVVLYAGNDANADQWLRMPNQHLDGRIPIEMIGTSETASRAVEMLVGTMEERIPN